MEGWLLVSIEASLLAVCGWRLRRALRTHRAWATFGVSVERLKHPRFYWALVAADLFLIVVLTGLMAFSVKDWLHLN